jgi:hypothetical protein
MRPHGRGLLWLLSRVSGGEKIMSHVEKRGPETFDGEGKPIAPTPPAKLDLHDARAIRRELASVYRDARAGVIEVQDATRLGYLLDLLRKAYETDVLQGRLELMERTLNQRGKP